MERDPDPREGEEIELTEEDRLDERERQLGPPKDRLVGEDDEDGSE